jgi:hypothetical protein
MCGAEFGAFPRSNTANTAAPFASCTSRWNDRDGGLGSIAPFRACRRIRDRLFPIFGPANRPGWFPSRARRGLPPRRPGFQVVPAEDRPGATKRRWPARKVPLGGIRHARLTLSWRSRTNSRNAPDAGAKSVISFREGSVPMSTWRPTPSQCSGHHLSLRRARSHASHKTGERFCCVGTSKDRGDLICFEQPPTEQRQRLSSVMTARHTDDRSNHLEMR